MRQAHSETGWFSFNVTDPEKQKFPPMHEVSGLSLGFDFCAEHESGFPFLMENFGIGEGLSNVGLPARTMTEVPDILEFFKFTKTEKHNDRSLKVPHAVLHCCRIWDPAFKDGTPLKKMEDLGLRFYTKVLELKPERPATHDFMQVVWDSRSGFAVAVRGEEHVAKLEELHAAILAKDIVFSTPAAMGFLRRGPALLQLSKVPEEVAAKCLSDDLAYNRLLEAAEATGIAQRLTSANLGWYALSPEWDRNASAPSVRFFLNPKGQDKYTGGWYTVDELDAWIQGKGPVVDSQSVQAKLKQVFNDFNWHVGRGLDAAGVKQGAHLKYVWLDDLKTKPGIVLTVHQPEKSPLKSGTYTLDEMLPYYEEGLRIEALKAATKAQATVA